MRTKPLMSEMQASRINTILLSVLLGVGAWGLSEVVSLNKQVSELTIQVRNLERLAYQQSR